MNIFANIYLQQCHTIYQTGTQFLRPPPPLHSLQHTALPFHTHPPPPLPTQERKWMN